MPYFKKTNLMLNALPTYIIQYSTQSWSDKGWVIALIGVIAGAVLTIASNYLRIFLKTRKLKKEMAISLYHEIIVLRELYTKNDRSLKDTLDDFINLTKASGEHRPTHGPSYIFMGESSKQYYKIYLRNLTLLDISTRRKIVVFYVHIESMDRLSKKLEKMFNKFYQQDMTIGAQDIIKFYRQLLIQKDMIKLIGADALAILIKEYKVDTPKSIQEIANQKNKILSYLKTQKKGNTIYITNLSNTLNIDIVSLNVHLLKIKKIKNTKSGEWKVIT